jgi:hypothetical protein
MSNNNQAVDKFVLVVASFYFSRRGSNSAKESTTAIG